MAIVIRDLPSFLSTSCLRWRSHQYWTSPQTGPVGQKHKQHACQVRRLLKTTSHHTLHQRPFFCTSQNVQQRQGHPQQSVANSWWAILPANPKLQWPRDKSPWIVVGFNPFYLDRFREEMAESLAVRTARWFWGRCCPWDCWGIRLGWRSRDETPRIVVRLRIRACENKQQSATGEFRVEQVICNRWMYYTIEVSLILLLFACLIVRQLSPNRHQWVCFPAMRDTRWSCLFSQWFFTANRIQWKLSSWSYMSSVFIWLNGCVDLTFRLNEFLICKMCVKNCDCEWFCQIPQTSVLLSKVFWRQTTWVNFYALVYKWEYIYCNKLTCICYNNIFVSISVSWSIILFVVMNLKLRLLHLSLYSLPALWCWTSTKFKALLDCYWFS